jgi:large subunit ribosomal protein L28
LIGFFVDSPSGSDSRGGERTAGFGDEEGSDMPRVCHFTGRKTATGRSYKYRGKAKYLGGVGIKIRGKSKRKFKPNLRTVTAMVDGKPQRVKASTKAIRSGMVVKPLKRKHAYRPESPAETSE